MDHETFNPKAAYSASGISDAKARRVRRGSPVFPCNGLVGSDMRGASDRHARLSQGAESERRTAGLAGERRACAATV